jgi:hypothetical protein
VTISYISAATNAGDTVTIGTHAAGDTIIIFAYNDGSSTIPTLPSGWASFISASATALSANRIGYKVATTSSETSGTWTNADGLIAVVYRPDTGNVIVPCFAARNTTTSTTVNYAVIASTFDHTNLSQWFAGFAYQRSDTNALETAPTGMTNRSNLVGTGWELAVHDTNADAASWTSANVTVATSALWQTVVAQLVEQPFYSAGGGSGLLIRRPMDGGYAA